MEDDQLSALRPAIPRIVEDKTQPPVLHTTEPVLNPAVLTRYGGRLLDPASSVQPSPERRARLNAGSDDPDRPIRYGPTAYVSDELLVPREAVPDGVDVVEELAEIAKSLQMRLVPRRRTDDRAQAVTLSVRSTTNRNPDAWTLYQAILDSGSPLARRVGLNHLMVGADISGTSTFTHGVSTFTHGVGTAGPDALYAYNTPGWGGRGPVAWMAAPPAPTDVQGRRRPVVAIVDTGVADHPWFPDDVIERLEVVGGTVIAGAGLGKEIDPNLIDPLEGELDAYFGHGTFIAGLLRQTAPDAKLLSIKVMAPDGIVTESDLLVVLDYLAARQKAAQATPARADETIDVLSLSLGYYHEDPGPDPFDGPLQEALDRLRSLGIPVVAAAGNDSTTRPFLPAGMSSFRDGAFAPTDPSPVVVDEQNLDPKFWPPLISVGALNPDLSVALFSNGGAWVSAYAPGAVLVSTTPIRDAPGKSTVSLAGTIRRAQPIISNLPADNPISRLIQQSGVIRRSGVDPDFFSGFGTWSGTSFAAPILAGSAAALLPADDPAANGPDKLAERAAKALEALGFPS